MELNAVTVSPSPIPSTPANAASGRSRDLYIDRLRSLMTALVILHHTALTYGAMGSWFWYELKPSTALSSQILIQFCTSNQAYFMAFFFFLAAYFTPASLERKGHGQFIADRFTRLGLPLLAFILILAPFTEALAHWGETGRFWEEFRFSGGTLSSIRGHCGSSRRCCSSAWRTAHGERCPRRRWRYRSERHDHFRRRLHS